MKIYNLNEKPQKSEVIFEQSKVVCLIRRGGSIYSGYYNYNTDKWFVVIGNQLKPLKTELENTYQWCYIPSKLGVILTGYEPFTRESKLTKNGQDDESRNDGVMYNNTDADGDATIGGSNIDQSNS